MKGKVFLFSAIVIISLSILPAYNIANKPQLFKNNRVSLKARNLYNMDAIESLLGSIAYDYGVSLEPSKVLIGKDGWLFLGNSFVDTLTKKTEGATSYLGNIDKVHSTMLEWNAYFADNGVESFKVIIGPDKDSIYVDKLPAWDKHSDTKIITSLIKGSPGLFVDTYTALISKKNESTMPLYYHTDTHWNSYGASVAFNLLAKTISEEHPEIKWIRPTVQDFNSKAGRPGDLANFLRISDVDEELVFLNNADINGTNIKLYDFKTGNLLSEKRLTVIGAPRTPTLVVSDNFLNDARVLWLRDSYGTAMSPFMSRTFKEVLQIHQGHVTPELLKVLVKSFKPKYVFITSVEREALGKFFTSPPDER